MLVLHLCKVSCLCRCIVQRLGSADISVLAYNFWQATKASLLGRSPKAGRRDASPRIHPRHGCRAWMHKGFARTQSQPSIHSLSRVKGGRGIGIINQKFISKTDFSYNLRPRSKERGHRQSINPRTAKMQTNHLTQN